MSFTSFESKTLMQWICALFFMLIVSGCVDSEDSLSDSATGDDEPATQQPTPADPPATPPDNTPPADPPPTDPPVSDVMQFTLTLHPELTDAANFCVGCHGNGVAPEFALADAQASYNVVTGEQLADLGVPMNSRLYERAAIDRHNCGDDVSCDRIAVDLLMAIQTWAGPMPGEPDQPPEDEMPPPVDPDPPAPPPATDLAVFEATLYPSLRAANNFCVACHGATQIPTFAAEDVQTAYNMLVTQQKVDLANPENSRIYLRPAQDRHNCGGETECDRIAAEFLAGIQAWAADQIPSNDPNQPVASSVVTLADAMGQAAVRAEANLIARFDFAEGTGDTTTDTSGVGTPIVLQLEGTEWADGGGLRNVSGKAQASLEHSQKLFDRINASGAYSVEAWVIPDNNAQDGPARIVSYSQDTATRNFTVGQNAIYYVLRNRSANTGANGTPQLEALEREVATNLTHVVMTFDPASGRKIYLDGQLIAEENTPDTLDWNNSQLLVLGNEVTNDRLWQGVFRMVAIHDQALNIAEVAQNFEAGLGDIQVLRFDLSEPLNGLAYIDMLFQQIDANGYMFGRPTYGGTVTGVAVKNIRIAVNGSVPVAAQAFRRVDTMIDQAGVELSPLGAVIPAVNGPETDQFHLEFEVLGGNQGTAEIIAPAAPPAPLPDVEEPDYGVRSFSQVNDSMSVLTGIDANDSDVAARYNELRGQLPASSDANSFSVNQQIAIQRLAVTYCREITDNAGRCNNFFGDCSIAAGGQQAVADLLFDRFIIDNLATQPMRAAVGAEVTSMLNDLQCANGCDGDTARTALAASCAAVLSSGAVSVN